MHFLREFWDVFSSIQLYFDANSIKILSGDVYIRQSLPLKIVKAQHSASEILRKVSTDILTSTFERLRLASAGIAAGIAGDIDADDALHDAFCGLWGASPRCGVVGRGD